MESYFERLQQIASTAVENLHKLGMQHSEMERSYLEDRRTGNLTEKGYQGLVQALDSTRNERVNEVKNQIAALQDEYNVAVDRRTALSSSAIDNSDVELLKNIPITPADFELLTEKHRHNPTMLRLLDAHRKEHDIKSYWRYQTPEQRKGIFNNVCWSVEAVATSEQLFSSIPVWNLDSFIQKRKYRIAYLVSSAYHRLQDSNPDKFPTPTDPDSPDANKSMRHTTIF